MRVISYNLRKHAARGELDALVETHSPNLLCLQEVDTDDLPRELGPLHLADATKLNRLGLAIFYNRDRFEALTRRDHLTDERQLLAWIRPLPADEHRQHSAE